MSVGVMNSIQSETFVECFKNLGMAFDKLSNTQLLPKGTIYNDDSKFNSLPSQNKNLSSKKTNSNLSEKNEINENEKNIEHNNDSIENYLDNISITKKTLRKNIEETINKE